MSPGPPPGSRWKVKTNGKITNPAKMATNGLSQENIAAKSLELLQD